MSDLQELTNELMADEEFRQAYDAIQPELDITRAIMDARIKAGITQAQLSERSGISQADISRLENGNRNPSLNLLKRLAMAMNMTLRIEFVPNFSSAGFEAACQEAVAQRMDVPEMEYVARIDKESGRIMKVFKDGRVEYVAD